MLSDLDYSMSDLGRRLLVWFSHILACSVISSWSAVLPHAMISNLIGNLLGVSKRIFWMARDFELWEELAEEGVVGDMKASLRLGSRMLLMLLTMDGGEKTMLWLQPISTLLCINNERKEWRHENNERDCTDIEVRKVWRLNVESKGQDKIAMKQNLPESLVSCSVRCRVQTQTWQALPELTTCDPGIYALISVVDHSDNVQIIHDYDTKLD